MEEISLQQLLEAGCHFGHQSKKWHPAMQPYLFGVRDDIHIFDLVKTKENLEKAGKFLHQLAKDGKTVLFVGTKRQAVPAIKSTAQATGMPYVSQRWLGGTLTNWEQIRKNLKNLSDMKTAKTEGQYKKYTKKEQILLDRQIARLEKFFGGITSLDKLPDALFIVDIKREKTAVREANQLKIPVVAVVDSNCDPGQVDVVISANDDGKGSIELILDYLSRAMKPTK